MKEGIKKGRKHHTNKDERKQQSSDIVVETRQAMFA
jgi:hypothetical protein